MKYIFYLVLFFSASLSASAQQLKGLVIDEKDRPLAGASIRMEGRDEGTMSLTDGRFRLVLAPGSYSLQVSFLGYADTLIPFRFRSDTSIVIRMRRADLQLETVEITRGKKDPAYAIMREVISRKKDYLRQFDNYRRETYMKLRLDSDTMPRKKEEQAIIDSLGVEALPEPGDNKSPYKLIESVSEVYFKTPGRFKTIVKAYYNSDDKPNTDALSEEGMYRRKSDTRDPYLFYIDPSDAEFNFYQNLIQAPGLSDRPYISPLHDLLWALTYRFRLTGTSEVDGRLVYEISVEALNPEGPAFSGRIWVEKGSFALRRIELEANASSLIFFKTFSLKQQYTTLPGKERVLALEQYSYSIKDGRVWLFGQNEMSHRNYAVDVDMERGIFNNELRRTEQEAYDRDSSYWAQVRPVGLEEGEKVFLKKQDSIVARLMSVEHLAELDSMYNQNDVLDYLFNGVTLRNRAAGMRYYFSALSEQVRPFGVGGYRHAPFFSITKTWKNFKSLSVASELNYGFNNHDLKGNLSLSFRHDPVHTGTAYLRGGDEYVLVNNLATIANIFSRSNYVRKVNAGFGYKREVLNGLILRADIDYADRTPIDDIQLSQWSEDLFGANNQPASFDPYREMIFSFRIRFTPGQKYQMEPYRKINLGSKWPTFGLLYKKAIPGILNSELNYDYLELGATQEFQVGAMGTSRWKARAGRFLQSSNIRFTDFKFIRGTDPYFFAGAMDFFQLLGPTLSTQNAWFEGHYLHDFGGALVEKIPLLKKLPLEAQAGGGLLAMEDGNFLHGELFAGLGVPFRIRKTRLKLSGYFVTSYTNINKALQGQFKFGISIFDPIKRRWNY